MTLITDSADLAAFCARVANADFLAVDTEFVRDSTYWPQLCLVQIAGPEEAAMIDALAPDLDLAPLIALMDRPDLIKAFHSARQDLEIFYHMSGRIPAAVVDTQVAAMVCGFGDSIGFEAIVRHVTGKRIDKVSRYTDWTQRPLSRRQLDYALADVIWLRPVYAYISEKLTENGRSDWLYDELAVLANPRTYRLDPEEAWRRLKVRSTDPAFLAVLREVAAWREREAQSRNVPRARVLKDEHLLEIAARHPSEIDELAKLRGVNRDLARGRIGQQLIEAVRRGLAVPRPDRPQLPPRPEIPQGLAPLIDLLKVLLKMKCSEHQVAQKLVASVSDLEQIALDDEAEVPALTGWRRKVFGDHALALKHGAIALSAAGSELKVVPLPAHRGT